MLLLYDLQSPINMGQILRSAEQFKFPVAVYDPRGVFANYDNIFVISDFSCGAVMRSKIHFVDDLKGFRRKRGGRFIATCLKKDAKILSEFRFNVNDTILLGNEYDGLPEEVIESCDDCLYIPLPNAIVQKPLSHSPIDIVAGRNVSQNGIPNLSVSMTAAIIGYNIYLDSIRE